MVSWTSIALLSLSLIPGARVQEKAPSAGAEAKPAAGSRAERFAAIQKEWDDTRRAFSKAYQEAKTPADREKLVYPDAKTLMPRVWDLVHEDSRDATALEALTWIVQMNPSKTELDDALTAVQMDHLKSPKLGDLCASLAGNVQVGTKLLEQIAAENPDHAVKGQALYAIASQKLESIGMAKSIASSSAEDSKGLVEYLGAARYDELKALDVAKAEKDAAQILDRVVKEFADVKGSRSTLGEAAGADLFELRDLALGKPAPDIEAEDLTGVKFKLSEYRGKVVLLDFWGNW
jgi:hypothetical protein